MGVVIPALKCHSWFLKSQGEFVPILERSAVRFLKSPSP